MVTNTKIDALNSLIKFGVPVSQVVDVGVQKQTHELIKCFPNIQHLLFEPAVAFHADINKNYSNIPHKLYKCAISDKPGEIFLCETSVFNNGKATHSHLSNTNKNVDGIKIISSLPIQVCVLDEFKDEIKSDCLLKVDVDGLDLQVLKGAVESLCKASIIVIEATRHNYVERAEYLQNNYFQLVNIVDRSLYGPALWQFDYIFVRKDILDKFPLPVPSTNFNLDMWINVDR